MDGTGSDVIYGNFGADDILMATMARTRSTVVKTTMTSTVETMVRTVLYGNLGEDELSMATTVMTHCSAASTTTIVDGGTENDVVYGNFGNDTLTGGGDDGNDTLYGGQSNDLLMAVGSRS